MENYFSWTDLELSASFFVDMFRGSHNQAIIGLERGGLPLAVMLSHRLNIPFESLKWQTRDGIERDEAKLKYILNKYCSNEPILIVDDICDTGITIDQISKVINAVANKENRIIPITYCVLVNKMLYKSNNIVISSIMSYNKKWVVFPWENK